MGCINFFSYFRKLKKVSTMSSFLQSSPNNYWRNLFTRLMLVVFSTALIVWLLPRKEGFQFKYEIGKPWMGDDVIAKFKFPVLKSEEAIEKEREELTSTFQPYFIYDESVENKAVEDFSKAFDNNVPAPIAMFKPHITRRLHQLYQRGIMSAPDYSRLATDTTAQVRVVNGKNATSTDVRQLLSTMNAYDQIFLDENLAERRSLLLKYDLNQYIRPNLTYDKKRSEQELDELLSSIAPAEGQVENGQKIIERGEIVNENTARILYSLEKEFDNRNTGKSESMSTILGQALYVAMLILLFTVYLLLFRRDYFDKSRNILMLYSLITLFPIAVALMVRFTNLSVYLLPFAMVAIFVRIFLDSRTAFMTHTTMVMISASAVNYQEEFFIIEMVAGMAAIFSLRDMSRRSQVFKAMLSVTLCTMIMYFALTLIHSDNHTVISWSRYFYLFLNGIFLLLAYPLMFLIEKTFGFTSDVTLFELSDTNKDLLRELSEVAPGTFQHSITVGNLAAEIANKIGANGLLVRTGALYHDIGKMSNPVFFTENQASVNPHNKLSEKESAQIIISHVTEGIHLAEKNGLPEVIKNFILTHHGTGTTKFFYITYKNNHPDEPDNPIPFTYPGPNPSTREQAILMMADGVEAASRSLDEYTEESISQLVNRMIDNMVNEGYFTECPITFRDILVAKQVLIDRLRSIYHTRIRYPETQTESEVKDEK